MTINTPNINKTNQNKGERDEGFHLRSFGQGNAYQLLASEIHEGNSQQMSLHVLFDIVKTIAHRFLDCTLQEWLGVFHWHYGAKPNHKLGPS